MLPGGHSFLYCVLRKLSILSEIPLKICAKFTKLKHLVEKFKSDILLSS